MVAAVIIAAVLGTALSIGRTIVTSMLVGAGGAVTPRAGGLVYDAVLSSIGVTALWIVIIALAAAIGAWVAGSAPTAARAKAVEVGARARSAAASISSR